MILLVEDEDVLRDITQQYLQLKGHEVMAVPSIAEALSAIDELGSALELLVVDHQLPDGVGWKAVELAQAHDENVPVLYVSGYYALPDPEGEVVIPERVTFLRKPYEMFDLLDHVNSLTSA